MKNNFRILGASLAVLLMGTGWATAQGVPYQHCDVSLSRQPWSAPVPPHSDVPSQLYRYPPTRLLRDPALEGHFPPTGCEGFSSLDMAMGMTIPLGCRGVGHLQWTFHCQEHPTDSSYCWTGNSWDDRGVWMPGDWAVNTILWGAGIGPQPVRVRPSGINPAVDIHDHPVLIRLEDWLFHYNGEKPTYLQSKLWTSSGQSDVPCYTMAHLFGFFNGVWNTRREAEDSLEAMELQNFLGPTWREAPVRYELFYNQTCKRSEDDVCLQDVAEVFRQRSAELDGLLARRWEYFWEQVTGQHDQPGSFTQHLLDRLARSDKALASWFDGLTNAVLAKITALSTLLAENPPTAQDTAEHTAQLITAGQRGERAVLVAHSQGNLFVNAAYDAYLAHSRQVGQSLGEDTRYVAAQLVHIAPASPTLRGPYVLADIDLVINGLRRADGTYLAVSNFSLAQDAKDASGHKLLDTYLDEARPARSHIRQLITQALDAL